MDSQSSEERSCSESHEGSTESQGRRLSGRNICKILKTEDTSFSETYDALILEEEEAVEVPGNRFWNLPVANGDGTSDVTSVLLSVVEEPSILSLLWDGSSVKKKVWEKVASEMLQRGCPILTAKNDAAAGAKCNQKWKNLVRMHSSHQKYLASSEKPKAFRPKPRFYDDIDRILSHRPADYNLKRTTDISASPTNIESLLYPCYESNIPPPPSQKYQSDSDSDSSDSSRNSRRRSKMSTKFSILDVVEILKQVRRDDRKDRKRDKRAREEDRKVVQAQFSQLMGKLDRGNELLEKMVSTLDQFLQQKSNS